MGGYIGFNKIPFYKSEPERAWNIQDKGPSRDEVGAIVQVDNLEAWGKLAQSLNVISYTITWCQVEGKDRWIVSANLPRSLLEDVRKHPCVCELECDRAMGPTGLSGPSPWI
jgi:hypothetical protein